MSRVPNNKTESRRNTYKAAGDADEGRRRREDDMEENRKKEREEILQKKRSEASTSSATTQPGLDFSSMSSQKKLESLPQMVAGIMSDDRNLQLEATASFRKLLSMEPNPPINEVIQTGFVPRIAHFLSRDDFSELQFEAAWALSLIASGTAENIQVIIDNGTVPLFVQLLSSGSEDVREQAVLALGNIAGDSPKCRNIVLNCGAMNSVVALFNENSKLSMLRNVTWTLSNLCIGKPSAPFEQAHASLPVLERILQTIDDDKVLTDACWALSNLSDGTNEQIQAVIDSGVVPRLVQLLAHPSPKVLFLALHTINNIVTGDDNQTQAVLDHEALPRLLHLLKNTDKKSILMETCRTISNITAGNVNQIQEVIQAGIFQPLIHLLRQGEFEIKKEAVWAISNATSGGNHDQIKFLDSQRCIKPLCDFLRTCRYGQLFRVTLQCLENLFNVPVAAGGLMKIENQADSDDPIYSKYIGSQVDLDDPRYECLLDPRLLTLKNLRTRTTKSDIFSFFKDKASIRRVRLDKAQNNTRSCVVELKNRAETRKALGMKGEVIGLKASPEDRGRHVFIDRHVCRRTLCVSHFKKGLGKEATRIELQKILGRLARIVGIFLPDELEFGYILVENWTPALKDALERGSIKKIFVREAFLAPEIVDTLKSS